MPLKVIDGGTPKDAGGRYGKVAILATGDAFGAVTSYREAVERLGRGESFLTTQVALLAHPTIKRYGLIEIHGDTGVVRLRRDGGLYVVEPRQKIQIRASRNLLSLWTSGALVGDGTHPYETQWPPTRLMGTMAETEVMVRRFFDSQRALMRGGGDVSKADLVERVVYQTELRVLDAVSPQRSRPELAADVAFMDAERKYAHAVLGDATK